MAEPYASNQYLCIHASSAPALSLKLQNREPFTVTVHVSRAASNNDHPFPFVRRILKEYWVQTMRFDYSREAFREADQRHIISTMIQNLDIPFPLQNIHWGYTNFPDSLSEPQNLDRIIDLLSDQARLYADKEKHNMEIRLTMMEKLSSEEYKEKFEESRRGPLDDWKTENKNDSRFGPCQEFLSALEKDSPEGSKMFGLRSKKIERDEEEEPICSICMKRMKSGCHEVQMPCAGSHIFHGFCILRWLSLSRTCPLCRFRLGSPQPTFKKARLI